MALLGAIERPGEVMEGCGCSTNCQKELTGGGGAVVVAGNGYGSEQSRRRWARVRSEEGEARMVTRSYRRPWHGDRGGERGTTWATSKAGCERHLSSLNEARGAGREWQGRTRAAGTVRCMRAWVLVGVVFCFLFLFFFTNLHTHMHISIVCLYIHILIYTFPLLKETT